MATGNHWNYVGFCDILFVYLYLNLITLKKVLYFTKQHFVIIIIIIIIITIIIIISLSLSL